MKNFPKNHKGMATIELLIAFAIMLINMTSLIILLNSGQSISLDSETSEEALQFAKKNIENRQAQAYSDFNSINNDGPTDNDIYKISSLVTDISPCLKQVLSIVTWTIEGKDKVVNLDSKIGSTTEVANLGGDCNIISPGSDDWKKPLELNFTGSSLKTDGKGKAVDAEDKIAFLTTKAFGNNKDDFYIFDATDPDNPIKRGHLDISAGLEDIDKAGDYAYIANDENLNINQLAIVNVSNLDAPGVPIFASLPNVTGNCPNTCPGGRSIYYYKNRVYIGTHRLVAGGAAEFHIFDVINPSTPTWLGSKGGVIGDVLDHNVNKIIVRDKLIGSTSKTYAYLALSNDSGEFTILNVTNPSSIPNPTGASGTGRILNLPGSNTANENLDATAMAISGNRAYIGRERATGSTSNKDFYIIDINNPDSPTIIGSYRLDLNSAGSYVSGIQVTGHLVFVSTTDPNNPFVVLDVTDPLNIVKWIVNGCDVDFSTYPTSIDYDNNLIYLPLYNATSNVNFKIIKSTGGSC